MPKQEAPAVNNKQKSLTETLEVNRPQGLGLL